MNDKMMGSDSNTTGATTTSQWPPTCPYQPKQNIEYGWVCPKCGRANAPWVSFCPCNQNWDITWTNKGTTGNKPEWWKDYVITSSASDPNTVAHYSTTTPGTPTTPTEISNKYIKK